MEKKKNGRPSKINDSMSIREVIKRCAERGFDDKDLAYVVGITEQTINNWKHDKEFFESLKLAKKLVDAKIEKSLFQRAIGYEHTEVKVFYDAKIGECVEHKIIKHYPPDTVACIFWLKNRDKERWRDTQLIDHTSTDNSMTPKENSTVVILPSNSREAK